MNFPNKLSIFRLFLVPLFVLSMSLEFRGNYVIALFLFLLASLTDWLDGWVARRMGLVTDLGKLIDPLADKILIMAALICLIPLEAVPAWVVITIVFREFLITGLRLLAGSLGVVLPAERLGKHKTFWQMATIVFFLILLAAGDEWRPCGEKGFIWDMVGGILISVTVILTIYSGAAYFWKNRELIRTY